MLGWKYSTKVIKLPNTGWIGSLVVLENQSACGRVGQKIRLQCVCLGSLSLAVISTAEIYMMKTESRCGVLTVVMNPPDVITTTTGSVVTTLPFL